MAELEQGLEELKVVKKAFKDNFDNEDVSTNNVEFRNMPNLLKQMEKKLPLQTKSVEPTKYPQIVKADDGYKLEAVGVREIPSQYIIPTGTKEITENNEYDVTQYSKVKVEVANAGTGTGGNPKFSQIIDGTIESLEESDLSEPISIKDYTFYYCKNLTSAVIPSNIASIGASAFEGCSSLQSLVIAEGVQNIGASAFKGINANIVNIPTTVSVLESEVFANNTALTSITIPIGITEIKDYAFDGCANLTEVTMESYVPIPVTENTFPANVTAIYVKYGAYNDYVSAWTNYVDKLVRLPAVPSTISITVNNYLGELVSGAIVTISGNGEMFSGITDDNGVYVKGDLQPAIYTISVAELDGFETPSVQDVVVEEGSENIIEITYLEKPKTLPFEQCTPMEISEISAEISAKNMTSAEVEATYGWKLGDMKDITLTTGEVIQMQIIGFNHDDKSDGTGKAGITLQMKDCLANTYPMHNSNLNIGGYYSTTMKQSILPTIKSTLPQEWQDVIKLVDKKSANGGSEGYNEILTVSEDLFFLSEIEVYGQTINSKAGEGTVYEYWNGKNVSELIKRFDDDADGVPEFVIAWWLRSPYYRFISYFCNVAKSGDSAYTNATYYAGVSFAFCV